MIEEEILDILKNADGYISGERISEMLNVSRTAIWKHIKSLRESGYKIESVTNKGYRLISSPDIITESGIKSGLTTDFIGHSLFIYDETDTTNNRAKGKQYLAGRQCIYRRSANARQRQAADAVGLLQEG